MRLSFYLILLVLLCTGPLTAQQKEKPKWAPSPNIAATDPLRPEEQVKKLKVPPGFEIQLVAADPDIRKPINIAFDAAGRLWVTETIEYPFAAEPGKGRDAVKILEDFGPDGKARKITTFADGLNIPIGVLPTPDNKGALVYSIPAISRMTDSKGLGKADIREILYSGFGFDDTHGMTGEFQQGFDGWIYACHGFRNSSKVKSKDGSTAISMNSGNTYRIKADGSRIEHFTYGQVNPFGIGIDPYGNLYTGDCHSKPLTMLLRGALYEHFGNKHDGLGFAPHMNNFKGHSTALCGVTYYAADHFPPQYHNKLFLGDVVLNRVNAYKLDWTGVTPAAVMEDFITSQDPWFRPVDIKLGPDGCLYIADFYNRVIGHYEVPLKHPARDFDKGRIWRVVYRGKNGAAGPHAVINLAKADVKMLVLMLGHANLAVRLNAADQLVERGGAEAVEAILPIIKDFDDDGMVVQKAHGLWVLERLGKLDDATLERASKSKFPEVRVHALRVLTERKEWTPNFAKLVQAALTDVNSHAKRVAVEALAAHPTADNVQSLVSLRGAVESKDTHLIHAIRLALREHLRKPEVWSAIKTPTKLDGDRRVLADVCLGVHNEQSAEYLMNCMKVSNDHYDQSREFIRYIIRYGGKDSLSWTIGFAHSAGRSDLVYQGNVLQAALQAAQERGIALSADDRKQAEAMVAELLSAPTAFNVVQVGVELAGTLKLEKTQPQLLSLVNNVKIPEALRKSCVTTLVSLDAKQSIPTLSAMLLNEKEAITVRELVANSLAGTNHPDAHSALVKALQNAPARLQTTIALGMASSSQGGDRLLQAIEAGKASPRLLQDPVLESRLASAKIANVKDRLVKLTKGLPPADQKALELIAKKRDAFVGFKADAELGQKIFQKSCANCHQINSEGAKIGPQLDGIGARGLERILEDVLDPNRNVDQAFRTTIITTKAGQTFSGLFLREEGNVVILADGQGKDLRIEKGTIDERRFSPLSPMPSNFAETIGETDFHHLVAFLLRQRGKQ